MKGLEPSTFCMASRRSSQLSYIRGPSEYSGAFGGRPVGASERGPDTPDRPDRGPRPLAVSVDGAGVEPDPVAKRSFPGVSTALSAPRSLTVRPDRAPFDTPSQDVRKGQ